VARLVAEGPAAAARKLGEEGLEAALAGAGESDERLVDELADLWFHSYVLLAARGLDPAVVEDALLARAGAVETTSRPAMQPRSSAASRPR
jgi:phosphoribosyl-ATP pyrophosphohydrolase